MKNNYDLAALRLDTMFDRPAPVAQLPAVISRGDRSLLTLIDGAENAPRRLLRILRPHALIGFRVDRPDDGVTVTMGVVVDEPATLMWHRYLSGLPVELRREVPEERLLSPDISGWHRTLVFRAQGVPVAAVVIGVRSDHALARQSVTFHVPGHLIPAGGTVMIGIDSGPVGVDWGLPTRLADGAVGVAVTRMTLEPGQGESTSPRVATGRQDDEGAWVMAKTGFVAVNPGADGTPVTLEVAERAARRHSVIGRRLRRRGSANANESGLEVRDLAGQPVPGARVDGRRVQVPAVDVPVLVRTPSASGPDWAVRVV